MKVRADTRLHCPYCYEAFSEQGIKFRCAGGIGRGCAPEADPVLRDRTGYAGALPPVFTADGRRTSAACPQCETLSTARVCPGCHSRLPVLFGKVPSRLIALVGAKQSGKTVFMTVLLHELMHDLGTRLDAAISGADEETLHRFASDYEKPLYRESLLLPPTNAAGLHNRVPLVFRFTTEGPAALERVAGPCGRPHTAPHAAVVFRRRRRGPALAAVGRAEPPLPRGRRRHHPDPGSAPDARSPRPGHARHAAADSGHHR